MKRGQIHFSIYPTLEMSLTQRGRAAEAGESHYADQEPYLNDNWTRAR